jgi:hypothetical protein
LPRSPIVSPMATIMRHRLELSKNFKTVRPRRPKTRCRL